MNICSDGHAEIVHDEGRYCPICALISEKDGEIDTLKDDLAEMTAERDELAKSEGGAF